MSSYIHFTEEQKQRAAAVDLEEFLRCRGEKLLSSGREKRLASDHSVTVRGNEWYDHAEERGGHARQLCAAVLWPQLPGRSDDAVGQ